LGGACIQQPTRSDKFREWFRGALFPRVVTKESPTEKTSIARSSIEEQYIDVSNTTKHDRDRPGQTKGASGEPEETINTQDVHENQNRKLQNSEKLQSDISKAAKKVKDLEPPAPQNTMKQKADIDPLEEGLAESRLANMSEARRPTEVQNPVYLAEHERQTVELRSGAESAEIKDSSKSAEQSGGKHQSGLIDEKAHHISEVIRDRSRNIRPAAGTYKSAPKSRLGSTQNTHAVLAGFIIAIVILAVITLISLVT
jgi:hypothetical protein